MKIEKFEEEFGFEIVGFEVSEDDISKYYNKSLEEIIDLKNTNKLYTEDGQLKRHHEDDEDLELHDEYTKVMVGGDFDINKIQLYIAIRNHNKDLDIKKLYVIDRLKEVGIKKCPCELDVFFSDNKWQW